jgi:ribulose-5-phosphate 4-epimerase/fuculose-1-phosphate aldolase
MRDEGYIKFECDCEAEHPPSWHEVRALNMWRERLFDLGLIGAYPDGVGFGNVSVRCTNPTEFIITASGTGAIRKLKRSHYTRVVGYDLSANYVDCRGPAKPSSESLTHAAFYDASHTIQAVIHVHHAEFWNRFVDELPTTSRDVTYGTPEMAIEISRLLSEQVHHEKQICVMGGHEDGIMAYGDSISHAASVLLSYYRMCS